MAIASVNISQMVRDNDQSNSLNMLVNDLPIDFKNWCIQK